MAKQTIKVNHNFSNYVYFKVKAQLLNASLHGTAAFLPLFLECPRNSTFENYKKNPAFMYYFEEIPLEVVKATLGVEQPIFYVLDSRTQLIIPIPQLIPHGMWNNTTSPSVISSIRGIQSNIEADEISRPFPNISIRSFNKQGTTASFALAEGIINLKYPTIQKAYSTPNVTRHSFLTHLQTQLYTRYYAPDDRQFSIDTDRTSDSVCAVTSKRIVLDSYLPFTVCDHILSNATANNRNISTMKERYAAISPLTADLFGIPQIPLREILTDILRLDIDYLLSIFKTVSKRKLTINFAGTGGTGINTIIWLKQISDILGIKSLFNEIHLFEKDYIDLSNIFRFPLPLSTYTGVDIAACKKVSLIYPYAKSISKFLYIHDSFLETIEDFPSEQLDENSKLLPNIITYGAPSVANRNFLSSVGNFITATHADNIASIYINPIADDTLQVETYGLIQLNSFFINQIRMAIGFIEVLASNSETLSNTLFSDYTFTSNTSNYFFNISTEMVAREIGGN